MKKARKSRSRGKDLPSPRPRKESAPERLHTHTFPIIILVVVAFIAYANAWPNTLVMDDGMFAAENRSASIDLAEVGNFFTSNVWASTGLDTDLYRPLLLVSVALDIQLFGDWVAGYHLVNILLHILVTVCVFGLVRYLLSLAGGQAGLATNAALLAALVFAVHPVNTEVVNSVFNRSDMLVSLGVAGGLWWFLPTVQERPARAWFGLGLIYLYVLLCKESGLVLPALAVSAMWLTSFEDWRTRLRQCIPVLWLVLPLGIYVLLRMNALEAPPVADFSAQGPMAQAEGESGLPGIGRLIDPGKIVPAFRVWFDAMGLLLWPHPLLAFHGDSETNEWLALAVQLALLGFATVLFFRKSPWMLLGLLFFYIMILPSSRVIGGGGGFPHLAERYIYSPSLGFVILLAFGLHWLARRFSPRWGVALALAATMILTPLTWARNSDWSSTLKLAEHDYNYGRRKGKTLTTLVGTLLLKGDYARAASVCDRHSDDFATQWYLSTLCGQVYAKLKRFGKAENAFTLSLNSDEGAASGHLLLAGMYLELNRRSDAGKQFELAVMKEQQAFMKEYLKADALIQLHPSNPEKLLEAREYLENALELQPRFNLARQRIDQLDETLQRTGRDRN